MPAAVVVLLGAAALFSDDGLLRRQALLDRLLDTREEAARLQTENARLEADARALRSDPRRVERAAAEALLVAKPGSTIYRFAPATPAR